MIYEVYLLRKDGTVMFKELKPPLYQPVWWMHLLNHWCARYVNR